MNDDFDVLRGSIPPFPGLPKSPIISANWDLIIPKTTPDGTGCLPLLGSTSGPDVFIDPSKGYFHAIHTKSFLPPDERHLPFKLRELKSWNDVRMGMTLYLEEADVPGADLQFVDCIDNGKIYLLPVLGGHPCEVTPVDNPFNRLFEVLPR